MRPFRSTTNIDDNTQEHYPNAAPYTTMTFNLLLSAVPIGPARTLSRFRCTMRTLTALKSEFWHRVAIGRFYLTSFPFPQIACPSVNIAASAEELSGRKARGRTSISHGTLVCSNNNSI